MAFIDPAAILDAQTIWDDETRQMKVDVIYSGMVEDYVPTWERFPNQTELERDYRRFRDDEAIQRIEAAKSRFFNTLRAASNV